MTLVGGINLLLHQMDARLRKIGQSARVIKIEMSQNNMPHIISPETQRPYL